MKTRLVKENTAHMRQARFQLFETTQRDPPAVFPVDSARSQSGGRTSVPSGVR